MLRRFRILGPFKWLCSLASLLTLIAFFASAGRAIAWISPSQRYQVDLTCGAIRFLWPSTLWTPDGVARPGWTFSTYKDLTWTFWWIDWNGSAFTEWLVVPVFIPFIVSTILAAALWYAGRAQTAAAFRRFVHRLRDGRDGVGRRVASGVLRTAAGLIIALFLLSIPWGFVLGGRSQTLILDGGRLSWFASGSSTVYPATARPPPTGVYWGPSLPEFGVEFSLWPRFLRIPLWLPFVFVAVPIAFLWWVDRLALPGFCAACGYDLTGNVSGRCPECGTPTSAAPSSPKHEDAGG